MNISLSNKTVLVTGGSRGIGASAVKSLAESGAKVLCHYNSTEPQFEDLPRDIHTIRADLSSTGELEELCTNIRLNHGAVDVLVNNAGVAIEASLEEDNSTWLNKWDATQAVNLRAAAFLCKAFIPGMIDNGGGVIINVSSRAAHRGDTPDYLAYAASKGGMEALTKSLARGYGKSGITAFGIAPGFTRTEMAEEFIMKYGMEYAMKDIALDGLTRPEDIAPLFVFLASGMAKHATGSTIDVNAASYVR